MKRILFVDDEPNVLSGLRRTLHGLRNEWEMDFLSSPTEALARMKSGQEYDVVVSDMQMPEMNGAEFLEQVREACPKTVRLVLSGHTDSIDLMHANAVAHQFLSKPCDVRKLMIFVKRSCTLRDHLSCASLSQKLLAAGGVPSMPHVYQQILQQMQSAEPEVGRVARLIEQDVGLSTKVLQLVNSAFMGLKHKVSDVVHACSLLGLDNLKSLVLMAEMFTPEKSARLTKHLNLDTLWSHSMTVAGHAKKIAEDLSEERHVASDAFTAGLLHEIGQIVLAQRLPEEFAQAHEQAKMEKISLLKAEKNLFGSTHAAIGSYLLELWGLPESIVEAVAYYDMPTALPKEVYEESEPEAIVPLTALHVAFCFAAEGMSKQDRPLAFELDTLYMERVRLMDRLERWWDLCMR